MSAKPGTLLYFTNYRMQTERRRLRAFVINFRQNQAHHYISLLYTHNNNTTTYLFTTSDVRIPISTIINIFLISCLVLADTSQ